MAVRLRRLCLRYRLLFVLCLPTIYILLFGRRQPWLERMQWSTAPKCIGWKATFGCIPLGPREPGLDKTCAHEVYGASGYCLCEGNITVARMSCGPHRFRCRDECAELAHDRSRALVLPRPLTCGPHDGYDMARLVPTWAAYRVAEQRSKEDNQRRPVEGAHREIGVDSSSSSSSTGGSSSSSSNGAPAGGVAWISNERTTTDTASLSRASSRVWDMVDELVLRYGLQGAKIPDPRQRTNDWVLEGRHIGSADVEKLRYAVSGLIRDLPPYPDVDAAGAAGSAGGGAGSSSSNNNNNNNDESSSSSSSWTAPASSPLVFSGRGVVMVGGGMRYLIPAWTNLHILRRTGCVLPVELWFPVEEFPTPDVEAALLELGVMPRRLSARDLAQRGYGVKVAALLLSSFQEVLFLDSDNAVLRDPTFLFDSEPYTSTGALLWPDYWHRTAAPEVPQILNISHTHIPEGTFESGQMVIDKARHWHGLLLAAYMNVYGAIFSELLSCYIGKGDKETFAYGMLAAKEPIWVSPLKPGSAGIITMVCSPPGRAAKCHEQYLGNTMVQYDTDGKPLFFHANFHKWDLQLPEAFASGWNRRWQVLQPGRRNVSDVIYTDNNGTGAGYDVEQFIYDVLRAFRCASWFGSYQAARVRMGETAVTPLDGFHPLPDYITFREFYRAGWTGNFMDLVHPPMRFGDRVVSWYYSKPRWLIRRFSRKICRWRRKLLPSFLRCKGMK